MGGMWSITLTDVVQFVIKTIGIFFLLLPFTWSKAGGYDGIKERVGDAAFSLGTIGTGTIITFFVVYTLGILIGQDIWQRVFTAKSPEVARWGGVAAGVYCLLYGVARCADRSGGFGSDARHRFVRRRLRRRRRSRFSPIGLSGIVLAAAVAAMMSTASGALIATATVARQDVLPLVSKIFGRTQPGLDTSDPEADVRGNRLYVIVIGLVSIVLAALINDIVAALTIAYDILVGGLLVPILGGLVWKRATGTAAMASMAVGTAATLITMFVVRRRAGQRTGVRRSGECTRCLRCAESDHGADSARGDEDLERASFRKGHGDGRTGSCPDSLKVGACRSARHKEVDRAQGR